MKKKKKISLQFQSAHENVQKRRYEKERKNLHVTTAFKLTNDQLKTDTEKARKRIAVCLKIASEKASCENWRVPIFCVLQYRYRG